MSMSVSLSILSRAMTDNRAALARASHELATGRPADLARAVGPNGLETYQSLGHEITRLTALDHAVDTVSPAFDAQLAASTRLFETASDLGDELLARPARPGSAAIAFETMVASVNTSIAGEYVFGGTSTSAPPLPAADTLLAGARSAYAGAATPEAGAQAVEEYFLSGTGGYAAQVGDLEAASPRVGDPDLQDVTLLDARAPELRRAMAGAALAAIAEGARDSDLAARAAVDLKSSVTEGAQFTARIGTRAARLDAAEASYRMRIEEARGARSEMEGVDTARAAMDLQRHARHAELIYAVTARISRLSLVNHLR